MTLTKPVAVPLVAWSMVEESAIEDLIIDIEKNEGPIRLFCSISARNLMIVPAETSYKLFELGLRMTSFALFRPAKTLAPIMEARGGGKILATSANSAMRGNAGQHAHAAAIGGRRMLSNPQCGIIYKAYTYLPYLY